jgi:hypothetical protein
MVPSPTASNTGKVLDLLVVASEHRWMIETCLAAFGGVPTTAILNRPPTGVATLKCVT